MILWILILMLLIGAIGAIVLGDAGSIGGLSGDMVASLAASVALLIFVASSLSGHYAGRAGQAIKDIAIWVGFALLLVLGYSYRDHFAPVAARLMGELAPPGTSINLTNETDERAVRIRRRTDGHFSVQSQVNGRTVTMLVDTGASKVVLTTEDAANAGIDIGRLNYAIPVQTANGTGFAAAVRLESIAIGGINRGGLDALVARPGALRESLLGMNFLKLLRSYEFSGDFLTFRG